MSAVPRMSQVIVAKAFTSLSADADKRTIISLLIDALSKAKKLPADKVAEVIDEAMRREAMGSTGIGHGIAIPHCTTSHVTDITCAYGQAKDGVDFDSLDGEPVHSVFLLLTPPHLKDERMQLMKSFASQIRKEHFCEFIQQVKDAQGLVELLTEFEGR
jgi:PTS system nitrogen regulatory IIA component